MSQNIKHKQHGFTIIELIIATSVFAVVLLLITFGILQIARSYYKGITESKTQDTARSIVDTLSQDIQFGSGNVWPSIAASTTGTSKGFCIHGRRYSYELGQEVSDSPVKHSLMVDNSGGCTSASPAQDIDLAGVSGTELLGLHMRLANLSVVQTDVANNIYQVNIRLVYGDDDLLTDSLNSNGTPGTDGILDSCKGQAGSQFCAVSQLSATVQQRVL